MEIVEYQRDDQEKGKKKKKKGSRGMHVIRVVLYMLRRRRRKPYNSGFWRRLVEPLRQLNKPNSHDITLMPPSVITIIPPAAKAAEESGDDPAERLSESVEVFTATSSSSSSGMSGYGSAVSLRDMDCQDYYDDYDDDDDDDDDDCYGDEEGGDDMIDAKAEEFIANFYAQIRMQNQAYMERSKAKRV